MHLEESRHLDMLIAEFGVVEAGSEPSEVSSNGGVFSGISLRKEFSLRSLL